MSKRSGQRPLMILLGLFVFLALLLAGLVLSRFIWVGIDKSQSPCATGHEPRVELVEDNLSHAASLLSGSSRELELGLGHIIPFPFSRVFVAEPYSTAERIRTMIGAPWPCADKWAGSVCVNDSYTSLIVVTSGGVVPVRLSRLRFDFPEGTTDAFTDPETRVIMTRTPGRDTVLIRLQNPSNAPQIAQ